MSIARRFLCLSILMCGAAQADPLEIGGSLQVNRTYENDDALEHIENTVEFALTGQFQGFELELGAESLNDADPDRAEISWTLGHTGSLTDGLAWSAAYSRSYLNVSGWDGHELSFGLEAEMSQTAVVSIEAIRDLSAYTTDVEMGLVFEPHDKIAFGVLLGRSGEDRTVYGEIGVAYALSDAIALELLYESAADEPDLLTLSTVWEFSLTD